MKKSITEEMKFKLTLEQLFEGWEDDGNKPELVDFGLAVGKEIEF